MSDGSNSSDDEWGTAELVVPKSTSAAHKSKQHQDDDAAWTQAATPIIQRQKEEKPSVVCDPGEPIIIVDMTMLSGSQINSEFDANAVNDPEAASKMKKLIESQYDAYAKNCSHISDGSVIPCGSSVYRAALVKLRKERQGHYFAPIFPPKK